MTMHNTQRGPRAYRITLQGLVDEDFVAAFCPPETDLVHDDGVTVLSNIQADQASMVGLVRHLHNLGLTILALESQERP